MLSKAVKLRRKINRLRRKLGPNHPAKWIIISRQLRKLVIHQWQPESAGRYVDLADFIARGWSRGDVYGVRLRKYKPRAVELGSSATPVNLYGDAAYKHFPEIGDVVRRDDSQLEA